MHGQRVRNVLDVRMKLAQKLWRRAGSKAGREPWVKPKWMRWATFSWLVLAGRAAQEAGDMIVLGHLGRGLERIMAGRKRRRRVVRHPHS